MLVQGLNKDTGKAQDIRLASNGAVHTIPVGGSQQVYDGLASWANGASANTTVNLDVPMPDVLQGQSAYLITITNPSMVSPLTVVVKNKEIFGGTARYSELARYGITAGTPDGRSALVQGWLLGDGGRISISNDTSLGASDGFAACVRVRKI